MPIMLKKLTFDVPCIFQTLNTPFLSMSMADLHIFVKSESGYLFLDFFFFFLIFWSLPADPYGGPGYHWQLNAPPPGNHGFTVPPKPSQPPTGTSRPPLSPLQAPSLERPPPYNNSSGGSGSSYSGPENPLPPQSTGMALGFSQNTFTYEELARATEDFSNSNLLGQGGFGYVHRGVLQNGKEVAVKQLKAGSGQGEREFQAEVEIISRVHHKHLVSLVGYCITGTQRMLVYEFVPNNTLEFHLHGMYPLIHIIDFSIES